MCSLCVCVYLLYIRVCVCARSFAALSSLEVAAAAEGPLRANNRPPPPPLWTPIRQSNTLGGGENACVGLFVLLSISRAVGPTHLSARPYIDRAQNVRAAADKKKKMK